MSIYLVLEKYDGCYIILFQVQFLDFKIQNIVGTCDVRFPIRVEGLNQVHGQFSRCVVGKLDEFYRCFWNSQKAVTCVCQGERKGMTAIE
jgi:hypothetical protein